MGRTLEEVLGRMYASEINVTISCFWDAGWSISLGDSPNDFLETAYVDKAEKLAGILDALIVKHYPESVYTKTR